MPYSYCSIKLSYIGSIALVALKLVYPARVIVLGFLCRLLKYCIGGVLGAVSCELKTAPSPTHSSTQYAMQAHQTYAAA
jgi:hypothetical protein